MIVLILLVFLQVRLNSFFRYFLNLNQAKLSLIKIKLETFGTKAINKIKVEPNHFFCIRINNKEVNNLFFMLILYVHFFAK